MVTHDLDSLHTVCDRIAVLADGKIIAAGPMETMLASEHPWLKAYFRGSRGARTGRRGGGTLSGVEFMETKANYVLIGLFTLAVMVGAFGFIFWLHHAAGTGDRVAYRVIFDGSVSGLRTGGPVLFNGIRVGEVTRLQLDPQRPEPGRGDDRGRRPRRCAPDTQVSLDSKGSPASRRCRSRAAPPQRRRSRAWTASRRPFSPTAARGRT